MRVLQRREFVSVVAGSLAVSVAGPSPRAAKSGEARVPTTVLFQGDSITDADRDRTDSEPNVASALGRGYPYLIAAAELAEHPRNQLRFLNRGVSGNKIPDLAERWEADTLALAPDVLSVLMGVNDFWHRLLQGYTGTVQDYERGHLALLDSARARNPRLRIVVLEPFVLRTGAVDARWFPEFDERRAAAARVARAAHATFIPLQAMFDRLVRAAPPAYWAADGVHPTAAGHAAIAHAWRDAFSRFNFL